MSMVHFFVSSLISFLSVVWFSEYKSFTSLVRFIPRYFIFLVAISNEIFFLISTSDVSLLVYKNAFDFWILTLYPAVLPKSFISLSRVFFCGVYRIFCVHYHVICNDSFTSSFPIWMPFTSFSCLIAVARTSNTCLLYTSDAADDPSKV